MGRQRARPPIYSAQYVKIPCGVRDDGTPPKEFNLVGKLPRAKRAHRRRVTLRPE
jgi:hypothetical protein